MAKATIKCARCDARMDFGGMSRSMAGSVSTHDALATIALMAGWQSVGDEWLCQRCAEAREDERWAAEQSSSGPGWFG